jgi:hypothetical protein
MFDEQATRHKEAQTHHKVKSGSHKCDEAQEHSNPCMTGKWKEITKDEECGAGVK